MHLSDIDSSTWAGLEFAKKVIANQFTAVSGQCQNKTEGFETGEEGAANTHPSDIVEFRLQYSSQQLGVTVTHSSYF